MKYKLIKTDKELDDNEIMQSKNFDGLLDGYRNSQLQRITFKSIAVVFILAVGLLIFKTSDFKKQESRIVLVNSNHDTTSFNQQVPDKPLIKKSEIDYDSAENPKYTPDKEITPKKEVAVVDFREATPKNGFDNLYDFFNKNLHLPDSLHLAGEIEVKVACIIDKNGNAGSVKILQGSDSIIKQETRRLVNQMPRWNPAIIEGDTVESRVSFSLKYIIN